MERTIRSQDFSQYVPYAVGATSDGLGWRGFRAEIVQEHAPGELLLPPMDHHLLNLIVRVPTRHEHRWDGRGREETAWPGAMSLVPAGAESYWRWQYLSEERPCDFHLHLQPAFVQRVAEAGELSRGFEMAPELCFERREVSELALLLMRAVEEGGATGALYAESVATALVAVLLRQEGGTDGAERMGGRRARKADLGAVCELIEESLGRELHLEELAAQMRLGPDHFARVFRGAMGQSPYQYVLGRRVARAREMLQHTAMPLAEVALRLGFADQAHFSTVFRRRVGQTPSAYRREQRR